MPDLPLRQIIHGDSLEVMKNLPEYSIDALHTDPPMNLAYDRKFTRKGVKAVNMNFGSWDYFGDAGRGSASKLDRDSDRLFLDFTKKWLFIADRLLKASASITVWMPDRYLSHVREYMLYVLGYAPPTTFYLHITNPPPRFIKVSLVPSVIPCIVTVKRKKWRKINWLDRFEEMHNFMEAPLVGGNERLHPTQKPVEVTERLLKIFTNEGDVVLDPFAGSGTTAVACDRLNRKWIGIEKDALFVELARKRLATAPISDYS